MVIVSKLNLFCSLSIMHWCNSSMSPVKEVAPFKTNSLSFGSTTSDRSFSVIPKLDINFIVFFEGTPLRKSLITSVLQKVDINETKSKLCTNEIFEKNSLKMYLSYRYASSSTRRARGFLYIIQLRS